MKWLDIGAVMAAWIASCVAAGWLISARGSDRRGVMPGARMDSSKGERDLAA